MYLYLIIITHLAVLESIDDFAISHKFLNPTNRHPDSI